MKKTELKILIADDSIVIRKTLGKYLSPLEGIAEVDFANNGIELLNKINICQPDVVISDVRMPYLDGIEAFSRIQKNRKKGPLPVVFFTSHLKNQQIEEDLGALLKLDWVEILPKPKGLQYEEVAIELRDLCLKLKASYPQNYIEAHQDIEIICIGASAGGPDALCEMFYAMGKTKLPIIVLQHNTPGYSKNYSEWLSSCTDMPIHIVENSQDIKPGIIYLPKDEHHLWVSPNRQVRLRKNSEQDPYCPSIDLGLSTAAQAYGKSTLGILLSGMGVDGVSGLHDIHKMQGITIVQNEESCKVYGMPRAALREQVVNMTLSPTDIAEWIKNLSLEQ